MPQAPAGAAAVASVLLRRLDFIAAAGGAVSALGVALVLALVLIDVVVGDRRPPTGDAEAGGGGKLQFVVGDGRAPAAAASSSHGMMAQHPAAVTASIVAY